MTQQTEKKQPDFKVHTVVAQGRGQTRIGPQIGVAYFNKDGQGLKAYLNAQPIPVDGQIELAFFVPTGEDTN